MIRAGLFYALAACCGWGFAFLGPLILADWPPLVSAAGRYIAYGFASVVGLLAMYRRGAARPGGWRKWRDATVLTLFGNLVYYALLSISVQKLGFVLPTLIIGMIPLTLSLAGRLVDRRPIGGVYLLAMLLTLAGLWFAQAPPAGADVAAPALSVIGLLCAFGALALWTLYGVVNTQLLKSHPGVGGFEWSSLQGAAALPFAVVMFVATPSPPHPSADWIFFIAISLVLGVVSSWAANAAWNLASTRLPPSLLGQTIVFETIAGIGYGSVWTRRVPQGYVLLGAALLIAGVLVALRESEEPASSIPPPTTS